jgi:formiminotetrahydrofolate cyclodeaminase
MKQPTNSRKTYHDRSLSAISKRSFSELLAGLAERSPAPGAGCAVAWTGAIAAGLLEMVAAFAENDRAATRASVLRQELLDAGQRELTSYGPVLEALRLPAGEPERSRQLGQALSAASEAPVAIARMAAEVAELAARVAAQSEPALRGDATAGLVLAEASTRAAARLVEINLRCQPEDPRLEEVAALSERARRARERELDGPPREA